MLEEARDGLIDRDVAETLSRTGFEAAIKSSDLRTVWQSPGWPALGNLASGTMLHLGDRASIRSDPALANPLMQWKRSVVTASTALADGRTLEARAAFGPRIAPLLGKVGYLFGAGLVWLTASAAIAGVLASRFAKDLERLKSAAERAQAAFDRLDTDDDDKISKEEFFKFNGLPPRPDAPRPPKPQHNSPKPTPPGPPALPEALKAFDTDCNGILSRGEMAAASKAGTWPGRPKPPVGGEGGGQPPGGGQ